MKTKALVVLSGGQDSVTCLAWAQKLYDEVEAISFNYGQRHSVELECAKRICAATSTKQHIIDTSYFGEISTSSALTGEGDISAAHTLRGDLPASFVPNRNAMFLTTAHALAQNIGADDLVTGVCQTDYSGYPDCRQDFIMALQNALNLGAAKTVGIQTPLMFLNKAETFLLADKLGALEFVLEESHTCYEGDRSTRHAWGYGCGKCPACLLRKKGYEEYLELLNEPPTAHSNVQAVARGIL